MPILAIAGPSGRFIGRPLAEAACDFLRDGRLDEVRLLSSRDAPELAPFAELGAKVIRVNWETPNELTDALTGCDLLVSALGMGVDVAALRLAMKNKKKLAQAAKAAGVKVYVPSEFGTDWQRTKLTCMIFETKERHARYAASLGLHVVLLFNGLFPMVMANTWGGDRETKTFPLLPGMEDKAMAVCAPADAARFAILAALDTLKSTPGQSDGSIRAARVFSFNIKMGDLVQRVCEHTGLSLPISHPRTFEQAATEATAMMKRVPPWMLGPLCEPIAGEPGGEGFDYTRDNMVERLNPNHSIFKPYTVEDYLARPEIPWTAGHPHFDPATATGDLTADDLGA